MHSSSNYIY